MSEIIDLTEIINKEHNDYFFNNSITMVDNHYIMTYRYNKLNFDEKFHPWNWWGSIIYQLKI